MSRTEGPVGMDLLETSDVSLLDTIDHLLNQGLVVSGEVILGLAGVDLIYLRLSAVLCAADRVLPPESAD
jgi:Gas vesicle protein